MGVIKDRFKAKADSLGTEIKELLKEHGNKVIGEVQLSQVYQGMRGMTGLVTETSLLDPQADELIRGQRKPVRLGFAARQLAHDRHTVLQRLQLERRSGLT